MGEIVPHDGFVPSIKISDEGDRLVFAPRTGVAEPVHRIYKIDDELLSTEGSFFKSVYCSFDQVIDFHNRLPGQFETIEDLRCAFISVQDQARALSIAFHPDRFLTYSNLPKAIINKLFFKFTALYNSAMNLHPSQSKIDDFAMRYLQSEAIKVIKDPFRSIIDLLETRVAMRIIYDLNHYSLSRDTGVGKLLADRNIYPEFIDMPGLIDWLRKEPYLFTVLVRDIVMSNIGLSQPKSYAQLKDFIRQNTHMNNEYKPKSPPVDEIDCTKLWRFRMHDYSNFAPRIVTLAVENRK